MGRQWSRDNIGQITHTRAGRATLKPIRGGAASPDDGRNLKRRKQGWVGKEIAGMARQIERRTGAASGVENGRGDGDSYIRMRPPAILEKTVGAWEPKEQEVGQRSGPGGAWSRRQTHHQGQSRGPEISLDKRGHRHTPEWR